MDLAWSMILVCVEFPYWCLLDVSCETPFWLDTVDGRKRLGSTLPHMKASQGIRCGYAEGRTSAAVFHQSQCSVPHLDFGRFLCLFQGRTPDSNRYVIYYECALFLSFFLYNFSVLVLSTPLQHQHEVQNHDVFHSIVKAP